MNRRLATRLADFHFAPTEQAQGNLLAEGVPAERIWVTGNTVIDALDLALEKVRGTPPEFPRGFRWKRSNREERWCSSPVTGGRISARDWNRFAGRLRNWPAGIPKRISSIRFISIPRSTSRFSDCWVAGQYPPDQSPALRAFCLGDGPELFSLSDSGGIQEEALHLGKPILVMRERTERPEVLEGGTARLVGFDYDVIVREGSALLDNPEKRRAMSRVRNPFGDGRAAQRIAEILAGLEF
jgi:UDP-N-acetylglucosamine 2-epimerase (non-hydrolysing)